MAIQKMAVAIDGMHCDECAHGIKLVAECVDGVKEVAVNYEHKTLAGEYDDERVSIESVVREIERIGYKVVGA